MIYGDQIFTHKQNDIWLSIYAHFKSNGNYVIIKKSFDIKFQTYFRIEF